MRKRILLASIFVLLIVLVLFTFHDRLWYGPSTQRLRLIEEIQAFEKTLGYDDTENFLTHSDNIGAYHYYFYTPNTELPYSLDDPALKYATGTRETAPIDLQKYDAFFYSIPAIAEIKTPVTTALLQESLPRFIYIIFHEDWHEQIRLPLGIEEPSGEVVSYAASLLFTKEKFGESSDVYKTLKREFDNKFKESDIYRQYYEQLNDLYMRYHAGGISEEVTLEKKAEILELMSSELVEIWKGKPDQLNNAYIAFQMTYYRHLSLMYQVYSSQDSNLPQTIQLLKSIPEQGADFQNMEELRGLEQRVIDYLNNSP